LGWAIVSHADDTQQIAETAIKIHLRFVEFIIGHSNPEALTPATEFAAKAVNGLVTLPKRTKLK